MPCATPATGHVVVPQASLRCLSWEIPGAQHGLNGRYFDVEVPVHVHKEVVVEVPVRREVPCSWEFLWICTVAF